MMCKTVSVRHEDPRPAEGKTLCHYTDLGLKLARGGHSSFWVDGEAHFMSQNSVIKTSDQQRNGFASQLLCGHSARNICYHCP
jgi:hypothetical protein